MDNLASVAEFNVRAGTFIPCIRILRGIDIAGRQQHATFTVHVSFSYLSGRVVVNLPDTAVPVSRTTAEESPDPVWTMVNLPAMNLPSAPDAGTQITCNAKITITGVSGVVTDCGYLDTALINPT